MSNLINLKFDASKLRKAREAKGLGLTEAAGLLGISKQRLFNYEQDLTSPDPDVLLRVVKLYDIEFLSLANRRAA